MASPAMKENVANRAVSVGTTPVLVSEEQDGITSQRYVILITNTSTGGQTITISPFQNATAGSGIVLSPGGYYADSTDSFYMPSQSRITAVSSAAGGTLSVFERVRLQ